MFARGRIHIFRIQSSHCGEIPFVVVSNVVSMLHTLRIDKQRPTSAVCSDDAVLQRQNVIWQPCNIPGPDFDGIRQTFQKGKVAAVRNVPAFDHFQPVSDALL